MNTPADISPSKRGQVLHGLAEICANFVLPYIVYAQTQAKLGQVHALLAASLPPILWSIIEFFRNRRIDALSLLVIAGIILSLLAFIGGGSVQFLQLRENLVTGAIGLAFIGSAAIGKPLIYVLARANMARKSAAQAAAFEQLRGSAYFEATMMIMTLVWGVGLLAKTGLASVLALTMPIKAYLIVSPVLGYGVMAGLALWTFLYAKRRRRIGIAMREAGGET